MRVDLKVRKNHDTQRVIPHYRPDRVIDDLAAYTQVVNLQKRRLEGLNHMLIETIRLMLQHIRSDAPHLCKEKAFRDAELFVKHHVKPAPEQAAQEAAATQERV